MSFFVLVSRYTTPVEPPPAYDTDAQAYITANSLGETEADLIDRIIKELKGTYAGENKVNTSETDYWSDMVAGWVFDRDLNPEALDLKLVADVTGPGSLNSSNGMATSAGSDTPSGSAGPYATLPGSTLTGMTYLSRADPGAAAANNGGYWALGVEDAGDDHANSGGDSLVLKSNGASNYALIGFTNGSNSLSVNPLSSPGSGFLLHWVSANSSGVNYAIGSTTGSDASVGFGFAPTRMRWGWTRLFSVGTSVGYGESLTRWSILLNRTTSTDERDELDAILSLT